METRILLPLGTGKSVDSGALSIMQRRRAIKSFLANPEGALQRFPNLSNDLITFFSQSTNPHQNDETGLPARGREVDFEKWKVAQEWAQSHLND